jgi:hypothetical protein
MLADLEAQKKEVDEKVSKISCDNASHSQLISPAPLQEKLAQEKLAKAKNAAMLLVEATSDYERGNGSAAPAAPVPFVAPVAPLPSVAPVAPAMNYPVWTPEQILTKEDLVKRDADVAEFFKVRTHFYART